MSLINDMLRDLDRRGGRKQDPDAESEALGHQSLLANNRSAARSLSSWLPALAAFVLVAALVLWEPGRKEEQQNAPSDTVRSGQGIVAESTEAAPGSAETTEVVLVPNFYPELLAAMEPPQLEEKTDHSAVIEQLMRDADRALERDRLTSPIEDNAYARYQQVLALAPEHAGARRGLARITRRYLDLAESYIDRGNALRAEVLLRRARTVQAQHPDIPVVAERVAALTEQQSSRNQAPSSELDTPSQTLEPDTSEIETSDQSARVGLDDSAGAGQPAGRLEVRPNAESVDQQVAQEARQLIRQGRGHSARLRLEKQLEQYPSSRHSAVLLAKIYLEQGDLESARQLLAKIDFLPVDEFAQLQAQLALSEGRPNEAIELLEQHLNLATENESYRATLAGLYYGAKRHAEAASHYRRLLDNFGSKPAYWLGLALALDAQNRSPSALEAYRRAQASGYYGAEGQGEVRDYIEQRIATLERQGN